VAVAADVVNMLSLATTGQQVNQVGIYAALQALCLFPVGLYTLCERTGSVNKIFRINYLGSNRPIKLKN